MLRPRSLVLLASLFAASCAPSATVPPASSASPASATASSASTAPPRPAWIARSDANAQILIDIEIAYEPESASYTGIETADDRIIDLSAGFRARYVAALDEAKAKLEARRATESDPLVAQDLAILLHAADLQRREITVDESTMVPFWNAARLIFSGVHVLLDDQVAPARRAKAVTRLRRYAGLEPGSTALVDLMKADTLAHWDRAGLTMPARLDVEKALSTSGAVREGIRKLFEKYALAGASEPLAVLDEQLTAYEDFVRTTVLPRARADFALPPAMYALNLERVGVDIPPDELIAKAHAFFTETQARMQAVAKTIADQRHLPSHDYRDVLRELKKEQIPEGALLAHYKQRLADIEAIIRREHLVTLPDRPARIRLGTLAESAQQPSPYMQPPRLIGNHGEQGEFVIPVAIAAPTGSKEASQKYDDFSYAAVSWTLTAHEVRPGHELQFDSMVERGTSLARAKYAFNSVNAEGWGLYSESIILPFMPPEGQLASLQFQLLRAARAFLDPELQRGKWTFDSARDLLVNDVGFSRPYATAEIERYTFRMPGQATSYFYGFTRLLELRHDVEAALGAKFDAQRFHDEIIDEGLLPHDLLRAAVLKKLGAG